MVTMKSKWAKRLAQVSCVAAVLGAPHAAWSQDPIKVGWIGSLSGVLAPYGLDHQRGVEFAAEKVNAAGGIDGRPIEVIYVDSKFDTGFAVQSIQRFALQDQVVAVIGDISSALTVAEVGVTARYGIPQVAGLAGTPKITNMGSEFIFRPYPSVTLTYGTLAGYATEELGLKTFATIAYDDEGGVSSIESFKSSLEEGGEGEIVAEEIVPVDTREFRSILTRLRESNPDALVLAAAAPISGLIASQVRDIGWDVQMLGHGGYHAVPEFAEVAGPAADGMILATTYAPGYYTNEEALAFVEDWKAANDGREPRDLEAHGYDSMMLIASALEGGEAERQSVRDGIAAAADWPGAAGVYTFRENGDVVKDLVMQKWEEGVLVPLGVFSGSN